MQSNKQMFPGPVPHFPRRSTLRLSKLWSPPPRAFRKDSCLAVGVQPSSGMGVGSSLNTADSQAAGQLKWPGMKGADRMSQWSD